jgi:hypothetical protein
MRFWPAIPALLLLVGPVYAQQSGFNNPPGLGPVTPSTPSSATSGMPAPQSQGEPGPAAPPPGFGPVTPSAPSPVTSGMSAPQSQGEPGPAALPPSWGRTQAPASPTAAINIVGRWTYRAQEAGVPEEVVISMDPNGNYNQFFRFPETSVLGNQILQIWGRYTLNGNLLTTTPSGEQVTNGPNPKEICNLQNNRCMTPELKPTTTPLEQVDENTIKTPIGIAKRLP